MGWVLRMKREIGGKKKKTTHDVSDSLDLVRVSWPLGASLDDASEESDGLVVSRYRGRHVVRLVVKFVLFGVERDGVLGAP